MPYFSMQVWDTDADVQMTTGIQIQEADVRNAFDALMRDFAIPEGTFMIDSVLLAPDTVTVAHLWREDFVPNTRILVDTHAGDTIRLVFAAASQPVTYNKFCVYMSGSENLLVINTDNVNMDTLRLEALESIPRMSLSLPDGYERRPYTPPPGAATHGLMVYPPFLFKIMPIKSGPNNPVDMLYMPRDGVFTRSARQPALKDPVTLNTEGWLPTIIVIDDHIIFGIQNATFTPLAIRAGTNVVIGLHSKMHPQASMIAASERHPAQPPIMAGKWTFIAAVERSQLQAFYHRPETVTRLSLNYRIDFT